MQKHHRFLVYQILWYILYLQESSEKLSLKRLGQDNATLTYGKMMLEEEIGAIRQLSGDVISHLTNTVCFLNHSYFKLGVKHYLEEMLAMKRVPKYFEQYFNGVMYAASVLDIKETTTKLIKTVKDLYDKLQLQVLTYDSIDSFRKDYVGLDNL